MREPVSTNGYIVGGRRGGGGMKGKSQSGANQQVQGHPSASPQAEHEIVVSGTLSRHNPLPANQEPFSGLQPHRLARKYSEDSSSSGRMANAASRPAPAQPGVQLRPGSHVPRNGETGGGVDGDESDASRQNPVGPDDPVEPPPLPPPGPTPRGAIAKPDDNDVLLGRGRPFHLHPGNQRMHKIVDRFRPGYTKSRRLEKIQIAIVIVKQIQDTGGRFLKKDDEFIYWYPVSDSVARKKVSHLLRERPQKAQRDVAEARAIAAAEAAKIPPVADEAIEVDEAGTPVLPVRESSASDTATANTFASGMVPPSSRLANGLFPTNGSSLLVAGASYPGAPMHGVQPQHQPGAYPSHALPVAGGSVGRLPSHHHLQFNGVGYPGALGMLPQPQYGFGAPLHGNNSTAAHGALVASYQHHRSMMEYHIRQLSQHPFHTSQGAPPFQMQLPPLPPAIFGPEKLYQAPTLTATPPALAQPATAFLPVAAPLPAQGVAAPYPAPAPDAVVTSNSRFLAGKSGSNGDADSMSTGGSDASNAAEGEGRKDDSDAAAFIRKNGTRRATKSPPARAGADPPGDRYSSEEVSSH